MISFTVNITPVPKGRPRFDRRGFARTPERTRKFEQDLLLCSKQHMPLTPLEGPLCVRLVFYLPRLKTKRLQREYPVTGSDLDNLAKPVLDAFNKRFWRDDSQIVVLDTVKKFSVGTPGIGIEIWEAGVD